MANEEHFRKLERFYLVAPTNLHYRPAIRIGEGWAEVPANEVGLAILGPLRELDEVAYLRFASVYRAFESADDFEAEIAMLRLARESLAEPTASSQRPSASRRFRKRPVEGMKASLR